MIKFVDCKLFNLIPVTIPALVIYTERLSKGVAALSISPCFVLVRESKRDDVGLIQHEFHHIKQFWKNPFTPFIYLLSSSFRFKIEVEAYVVQNRFNATDRLPLYASFLAKNYRLKFTEKEALEALRVESAKQLNMELP